MIYNQWSQFHIFEIFLHLNFVPFRSQGPTVPHFGSYWATWVLRLALFGSCTIVTALISLCLEFVLFVPLLLKRRITTHGIPLAHTFAIHEQVKHRNYYCLYCIYPGVICCRISWAHEFISQPQMLSD